jgi:hypothetical protein
MRGAKAIVFGLAMTIRFRLDSDQLGTALDSARELIDYVTANWARFLDEDDPYPYADLPEQYDELRRRLADLG